MTFAIRKFIQVLKKSISLLSQIFFFFNTLTVLYKIYLDTSKILKDHNILCFELLWQIVQRICKLWLSLLLSRLSVAISPLTKLHEMWAMQLSLSLWNLYH